MRSIHRSFIYFPVILICLFGPIYLLLNYAYSSTNENNNAEYILEIIYKVDELPANDPAKEYISWLTISDLYFVENEVYRFRQSENLELDWTKKEVPFSIMQEDIKNMEIIVDENKKTIQIIFQVFDIEKIEMIKDIVEKILINKIKNIFNKKNDIDYIVNSLESKNFACNSMLKEVNSIRGTFSTDQKKNFEYFQLLDLTKDCTALINTNNTIINRIQNLINYRLKDNIYYVVRKNDYYFLGMKNFNLLILSPIISLFLTLLLTILIELFFFFKKLKIKIG